MINVLIYNFDPTLAPVGKTLRGLDNFYMAGQRVNPGGGMPTAVMSGRHTIQIICKRDKHRFVATTP